MTKIKRNKLVTILVSVALSIFARAVAAQTSTLPLPSRSMYKCTIEKKVTYTDEPCLGAQRIEVEPTRGLNKYSGREITGPDVANEKRREVFANAIKPLTGMNEQQFAVQTRRQNLSVMNKSECATLDVLNAKSEAEERNASAETKPIIQHNLFAQRKKYKDLRC